MKLKNQALRTAIRAAAFLFLLGFLFCAVQNAFCHSVEHEEVVNGTAAEPRDSLDAVFIGASDAFKPWMGPIAWHKYGIAARPCATGWLPTIARPYYVEQARKTQPNALYVIVVQPYSMPATIQSIHSSVDQLPLSLLKLRLIKRLADAGGFSAAERVSFYIPLIQYHTKWLKFNGPFSRLFSGTPAPTGKQTEDDLKYEFSAEPFDLAGRKGVITNTDYLFEAKDMTSEYHQTEERAVLPDECRDFWNDFLDDLDANKTRALFVLPPVCKTVEEIRELNSVGDLLSARGYPVLDLIDKLDEIGLDLKTDYYDANHTNVHGAILFTDYMARYLIENYGFADKRGQPGYESWDKAYELLSGDIMPALSGEEIAMIQ